MMIGHTTRRHGLTPAIAVVAMALAVVACEAPTQLSASDSQPWADLGKACPPGAPAYGAPEQADVEGAPTRNRLWAGIARDVPGGWGGIFGEDGVLTMYMVDPSQREEAIEALSGRLEGFSNLSSVRVKQGRWDFAQLWDWFRYISPHVWAVEGVTKAVILEAENRVEYGAMNEDVRTQVNEVLAGLDLPCFLVSVVRFGPVVIGG